LRVVSHLNAEAERLSVKHKARFLIAESRDINAPHRLARLDLKKFGLTFAGESDAYYTNSVKLPVATEIGAIEKVRIEGALQGRGVWNSTTDFWLGVDLPSTEGISSIIAHSFYKSRASAITFSPEFTICTVCQKLSRGLHASCPHCGSTRLDGLAQATNRYGRTSTWPRWKLEELKQRKRFEI